MNYEAIEKHTKVLAKEILAIVPQDLLELCRKYPQFFPQVIFFGQYSITADYKDTMDKLTDLEFKETDPSRQDPVVYNYNKRRAYAEKEFNHFLDRISEEIKEVALRDYAQYESLYDSLREDIKGIVMYNLRDIILYKSEEQRSKYLNS